MTKSKEKLQDIKKRKEKEEKQEKEELAKALIEFLKDYRAGTLEDWRI